jgi:hypothetical protein
MPKRTRKANRPESVRRSVRKAAMKMTRQQALALLMQQHTHDFISADKAREIAKPFGIEPYIERIKANDGAFKGLTTNDGKPRTIEGVSVYSFSARIADSMNDLPEGTEVYPGYVTSYEGERDYATTLGRGSMARAAWSYIAAALRLEAK